MKLEIDETEACQIIEKYLSRFYKFEYTEGEGGCLFQVEERDFHIKYFCAEVILP